jgi:hypothetical protein
VIQNNAAEPFSIHKKISRRDHRRSAEAAAVSQAL